MYIAFSPSFAEGADSPSLGTNAKSHLIPFKCPGSAKPRTRLASSQVGSQVRENARYVWN